MLAVRLSALLAVAAGCPAGLNCNFDSDVSGWTPYNYGMANSGSNLQRTSEGYASVDSGYGAGTNGVRVESDCVSNPSPDCRLIRESRSGSRRGQPGLLGAASSS